MRVDAVEMDMDEDGELGRKKDPRDPNKLMGGPRFSGSGPSSRFKGALRTLTGPRIDLWLATGAAEEDILEGAPEIPNLLRRFDLSRLLQGVDNLGWIL